MAHQCTICYTDFAFDTSVQDKSFLPVQSRVCSHTLCYACLVAIYQNNAPPPSPSSGSGKPPSPQSSQSELDSIPCPECRMPNAHNPFRPIVSRSLCELLTERHKLLQRLPEGTYEPSCSPTTVVTGGGGRAAWDDIDDDDEEEEPVPPSSVTTVHNNNKPELSSSAQELLAQILQQQWKDLWDMVHSTLLERQLINVPWVVWGARITRTVYWTSRWLGGSPGSSGSGGFHDDDDATVVLGCFQLPSFFQSSNSSINIAS